MLAAALAACGGSLPPASSGAPAAAARAQSRWIPATGDSIQIQYDGKLDLHVAATIYDLDLFDTPASVVAQLHTQNRRVLCYVDVGTWENWRPDAKQFPKSVLGRPDGHWKGERWLDIRQTAILEPLMAHRLDLCKKKGFDGADPDNIDGYQNKTGFPLTGAEQLVYDGWVAQASHDRGLTVDQKNDPAQIKDFGDDFDFAVDEQCYVQLWCDRLAPYVQRNRLVVDIEYFHDTQRFLADTCPEAAQNHDTAILKRLQLTAWILTCKKG